MRWLEWALMQYYVVFMKRGKLDTETQIPCGHREKMPSATQREREIRRKYPADTLISDLQPPELWVNKFLLSEWASCSTKLTATPASWRYQFLVHHVAWDSYGQTWSTESPLCLLYSCGVTMHFPLENILVIRKTVILALLTVTC
jgi:hypothetical protein